MKILALALLLFALVSCAFAQQNYVGRFDSFVGFSFLDTPKMNLLERGFITEEGVNINRWLGMGADFSVMTGHSGLRVDQLVSADRAAALEYFGPYGVTDSYAIPYNSTTYTYCIGPEITIRKMKGLRKVTLFFHPDIGAIHQIVTADAKTPLAQMVVAALVPGGKRSDTTYFYGVGAGAQYALTRHFGVRLTADFVLQHLFSNLLADSRTALRIGIGPTFSFGKNVQ
jgi:opacity protein-like surface antigen